MDFRTESFRAAVYEHVVDLLPRSCHRPEYVLWHGDVHDGVAICCLLVRVRSSVVEARLLFVDVSSWYGLGLKPAHEIE